MKNQRSYPAVAIFGAAGFIGRNLLQRFSVNNFRTVGITRTPAQGFLSLDLLKPDIPSLELKQHGVSHAVIAAGMSKIAACESDPVLSRKINVLGTVELATQLCDQGIKVIALSSDYVFDGSTGLYGEASPVAFVNEYGRQKAGMEELLIKTCGENVLILRLSKVFDMVRGSRTLLDEMAGMLTRRETVLAARDQLFCPTCIDDVVEVIVKLMATDVSGVMHLCAPQRISRFELARSVAEAFGADANLVKGISLKDLGENFSRPLDTSMICDRLGHHVKHDFMAIKACIEILRTHYQEKRA
jgi:dTDP-4-dehydrorhamnose reductase